MRANACNDVKFLSIGQNLKLRLLQVNKRTKNMFFQEALNEAAMSSAAGKKGQNSLAMAAQDCRILVKTLGQNYLIFIAIWLFLS